MIIGNYTVGSDFELPVRDRDIFVPALMVEGTKLVPKTIGEDCFIQRDGVAAEFNIPPVNNKLDFIKSISYCIATGNNILSKHNLVLDKASSYMFNEEELNQSDLRIMGCSSSHNAYQEGATLQNPDSKNNLRTFGFHIHLGFNRRCIETNRLPNINDFCKLTFYFDLYLGMFSVFKDSDNLRRSMYGKPGDFRYKIGKDKNGNKLNLYEYRVLGSNLIEDSILDCIYENINHAVLAYNANEPLPELELMQSVILNSDVILAKELYTQYASRAKCM